jgi:hypothetical protein
MASNQDRFDNIFNLIRLRQFLPSRTNGQLIFDMSFGVVAPIACFIFDPIVFQSGQLPGPLLPSYQTFTP